MIYFYLISSGVFSGCALWYILTNEKNVRNAKLSQLRELKPYLPDDVYYPRLKELGSKVD